MPDWGVAGFADRGFRKFILRRLQFLKACDIRFEFSQPTQECRQPSTDAVDVEGCDLQRTISRRNRMANDAVLREPVSASNYWMCAHQPDSFTRVKPGT
jgi:hypothetical protein